MSVAFLQIPMGLRAPGVRVEYDSSRAVAGLSGQPHKILVLGQRLPTGQVDALVPTRITSASAAEAAFGRGSMLAAMLLAVKRANPYTECWAIALDDAESSIAASKTLTLTGSTTKAGVMSLCIAGEQISLALEAGTDASAAAEALTAAIAQRTDLPLVAVQGIGEFAHQVTFTCRWKGITGTDINIDPAEGEFMPPGLNGDLGEHVDGAVNPDLSDAIGMFGDVWWNTIITPYTDAANLGLLEAEAARRWGPLVAQDAHIFAAKPGRLSDITSLSEGRNSRHLTIMAAGGSPTPPWIWAAVVGAVDAGEPHPRRPRQTLPLPGLVPAPAAFRFTLEERELLLHSGAATHVVDAGGVCRIERLITTYRLNAAGLPDTAWLDVTTLRTLSFFRFDLRAWSTNTYPRHLLARDDAEFGPGQAVVTPGSYKAGILGRFKLWERAALAQGREQFKADLVVEVSDHDPNVLDVRLSPALLGQLLGVNAQIQFLF